MLYEMLVGKRPVDGEDTSETLAYVLTRDPDWTALPAGVSPAIRALLKRCLERDRRRRVADMSVALFVLDEASFDFDERHHATSPSRRLLSLAAVALVSAAVAVIVAWLLIRPAPSRVVRTIIPTTGDSALRIQGTDRDITITPDGSRVVYRGTNQLVVRLLDLD